MFEYSKQLISLAISMIKMKNSRTYKEMEEDEAEVMKMNEENN